jgi:hypothetical protein
MKFLESRARLVHKANNITAIGYPIVETMWDPDRLTILLASTACYEDSLFYANNTCSLVRMLHVVHFLKLLSIVYEDWPTIYSFLKGNFKETEQPKLPLGHPANGKMEGNSSENEKIQKV